MNQSTAVTVRSESAMIRDNPRNSNANRTAADTTTQYRIGNRSTVGWLYEAPILGKAGRCPQIAGYLDREGLLGRQAIDTVYC